MTRQILGRVIVLALAVAGLLVPSSVLTASSAAAPSRSIAVSGAGVASYPSFSPAISRYGVTTTAATGGTITVTATTTDPAGRVWVDGRAARGPVQVTGLEPGEEVSVRIADSAGVATHALVYLPAGFPALAASVADAAYAPDWVALTLTQWWGVAPPTYETVVDRHGVPGHVTTTAGLASDLKPLPDGGWSVTRPVSAPGRTGSDIVVLDERFRPVRTHRTGAGIVDTDHHDSILRPDGSAILIAYEYREGVKLSNGKTQMDAVIQEIAPDGRVLYTWNSGDHVDPESETVNMADGDYAHINSIQQIEGGDIIASFRHFSSVFRIAWSDRGDVSRGDVVWKLGGRDSSFELDGDPASPPGPCAQHTATMFPNGNVLLFDNGSADMFTPMCVDPEDPEGAPVANPHSRAVEYALDEDAGTARMVWSDETDRFTFFAGSAYRQADESTLVSYALDRRAVARVADPSGATAWELRDAANDGVPGTPSSTYGTYRAHEARQPDAFAPTAAIESPTAGQVVQQGDPLVLQAHCTDRGGSTLSDCSAAGKRSGDALDTSTVGTHTVQLTATDGAGHRSTDQVTYTVQPAAQTPPATPLVSRPDVTIRTPKGWTGGRDYSRKQRSVRNLSLRRGVLKLKVRVVNRGTATEAFTVRAARTDKRFRLRYKARGVDVTRRVTRGTHRTRALRPGESVQVKVVVRPGPKARPGTVRAFRVRGRSTLAPTTNDSVQVRVRARRR